MVGAVGVMKRTELFYVLLFRLRVGDCGRTIRRDFFVLNFFVFLLSAKQKRYIEENRRWRWRRTNERIDTSAGNEWNETKEKYENDEEKKQIRKIEIQSLDMCLIYVRVSCLLLSITLTSQITVCRSFTFKLRWQMNGKMQFGSHRKMTIMCKRINACVCVSLCRVMCACVRLTYSRINFSGCHWCWLFLVLFRRWRVVVSATLQSISSKSKFGRRYLHKCALLADRLRIWIHTTIILSTKIEIKINLNPINGPSVRLWLSPIKLHKVDIECQWIYVIRVSAILLISFINFILFSRCCCCCTVIVIDDFSKGISTKTLDYSWNLFSVEFQISTRCF